MDEKLEIEPDLSSMFPPVEVDMVVDDAPIVINNDNKNDVLSRNLDVYKEEMLKNGLVDSDIDYFNRAYKNLEEVKFIKIHCTGCDKHMGSAPNEYENRFQHPILKVLLCAKCFQFYCSGEFEKGEDGSELYCRWCGEGGLVYCCTKCPFVFCKNCITRNLGRGTARIIENTEYWICFSCNPWQISRHRATYWAIQKFSEEMIAKSKITGDVSQLQVDLNVCCQGKKRAEPCEKSRTTSVAKKAKVVKVPFDSAILESVLQNNTPSTSKGKKPVNLSSLWQSIPLTALGPEDEVICTPDIIPIDESPPSSPLLTTPPPLIPYIIQQQSVSKIQPQSQPAPSMVGKGRLVPINIKNLQKSVQATFQKQVFTPISKLVANPSSSVNFSILNQEGLRIVHHPSSPNPVKLTQPISDSSKSAATPETENDWFDKAIIQCAEVTEYVSTKISGLSGVHSRAHKSERLMEELHNTLQTYIHVAIDKMRKIKRDMQVNFDKEINNKSEKIVNPFAKTKPRAVGTNEDSSSQDTQSASEDDNYVPKEDDYSTQDTDSTITSMKSKRIHKVKTIVPRQKSIQPTTKIHRVSADDDVIFDMDVTNASDEEMESRTASSLGSEAHFQTGEVINIISSDDDSDVEEVVITNKADEQNQNKTDDEVKEEVENKTDEANKKDVTDETEQVKLTNEEEVDKTNEETKETPNETNEVKADKTNEAVKTNEETPDKTIKDEKQTEETDKTTTKETQVILNKEDTEKETPNIIKTTKHHDSIEELVKKVETKFNIKNISSKDLFNYLSAQVILYNNRRAQKEFAKTANTETKLKQFNVVDTIEDILNTKWQETNKENGGESEENRKTHINDVEMEEPCDVEEMLGSSVVVLRAKKSFGDEFSRFIDKSSESECLNVESCDEEELSENDDISDNIEANDLEDKDKLDDEEKMDEGEKINDDEKVDDDEEMDEGEKIADDGKMDEGEKNGDDEKMDDGEKLDDDEEIDEGEKTNDDEKMDDEKKVADEEKLDDAEKLDDKTLDDEEKSDNVEKLDEGKMDNQKNDQDKLDENNVADENKLDDERNNMSDDSDLDEAELFFNKDNESLSLPPDGIGDSITTNNIFATKETENSDLVLDSGILALKQMAENCVNPTVELRQASTECNG